MSTPGGWYAAQSKSNPDLFRVIFDFNRRPQFWVHESILEGMPHTPVVKALAGCWHGSRHLSKWMMRELALDKEDDCWDFEEPRRRLSLLGPETLARLARYCGAVLSWPRIVAIIGKAQIQELKAGLGEDAHAFALRRGRMLVPESETVVPENREDPIVPHALEVGWRLLLTAVGEEEPGLSRRLSLKLPPELPDMKLGAVTLEVRERAWQRVQKVSPQVLTEGEMKCFA